jgi:hypothetical protein
MHRLIMPKFSSAAKLVLALLLWSSSALAADVMSINLEKRTLEGFNHYVQATEARIDHEVTRSGPFLHIESLPEPQSSEALTSLHRGDINIERLLTPGASGSAIEVPDGLVHHWIGAVFIPRATLPGVLDLVEDYDHHQDIYKPEVVRSRLLHHQGNNYQIYYRLVKRKIITVTLDTNHDVEYFPIDATHCRSRSVSTRIAEITDADQSGEHEKPVGQDSGFLWRMNSYWRFEQKDGGVYVEVEAVSLTRDIPSGLGWIVRPFVTSIPRESLLMTLGDTRTAVEARIHSASR